MDLHQLALHTKYWFDALIILILNKNVNTLARNFSKKSYAVIILNKNKHKKKRLAFSAKRSYKSLFILCYLLVDV